MKKLCLVLYIYGEKYQEFIPLFLLSLFKIYPNYGVRIYLEGRLLPVVRESLEIFKGNDYKIIENNKADADLSSKACKIDQIQRCNRWIFFDPDFKNYDALYIGDVDIFFCPEKNEIYDAHIAHCEYLGSPYSNIKRIISLKKLGYKNIIRNVLKFGFRQAIDFFLNSEKKSCRLSGLHFIKTTEYINNVLPLKKEYVNELNRLAEGKSKKYNLWSFNNEAMLYDLMLSSGFGDIPDSSGGDYNIAEEPIQPSYRPHHGIHFGIFRNMKTANNEKKLLTSSLYLEYYKYFCKVESTEEYIRIERNFSPYIKNIINNMHTFYKDII